MRLRLGYIIIALGVAGVAAIIAYGLGHPGAKLVPPVVANALEPSRPPGTLPGNLSVKGSSVTKNDKQGHPEWTMQAGTELKAQAGSTTAEAQNVDWKLLQGSQTQWIVNAPQVTIDTQSERVVFSEGVKVESADGSRRFSADRLTYVPETRELVGDGNPRFSQGGMLITGKHLIVDTRANIVRFTGGMKAHIGK